MTKVELIEKIAEITGSTKKVANHHLEILVKVIEDELEAGRDISVLGLGTFKVSHRKERQGRNPSTGATLKIKASNSVSFKVAKNLKEKLNK